MHKISRARTLYLDLELTHAIGPDGEHQGAEIFQIGIVEADMVELKITRSSLHYVRPTRSVLTPFITELCGTTPEQLRKWQRPYAEVVSSLVKKWGIQSKVCFAWGYDEKFLREAAVLAGEPSLAEQFNMLDYGQIFSAECGLKCAVSLPDALKTVGQSFEGREHNARDDAFNLARFHMALTSSRRLLPGIQGLRSNKRAVPAE